MATEIAKAYVQILPSTKGIKSKLQGEMNGAATSAGNSAGSIMGKGFATKLIGVLAAAKIGQTIVKGISEAVKEGAALEQSTGGIETLFKDSADIVIENAKRAYKTAGMSANEYMENVTSFSASLLQGLGGDTQKAAKVADMAMQDMSDNANKMGTDMSAIQTAYQGFAKQNYTMLDNLKLGYGGTKSEMERLLADAEKLTGVKYNIENLSDVYEAIHVIQGELDITGTTAKEASETISGSFAAMKSAWTNVLGYMATGQDLGPALTSLIDSASTFLFGNLLPMIGKVVAALPGAISTVVTSALPILQEKGTQLVEFLFANLPTMIETSREKMFNIITGIINKIDENLPNVLQKGVEFINNMATGFIQRIPHMIDVTGKMITTFLNFILTNLPSILKAGADILLNIARGITDNLPQILESASKVMGKILSTIADNLPAILKAGVEIIVKLATGTLEAAPKVYDAFKNIAVKAIDKMIHFDWIGLGKNILNGIVEGFKSGSNALLEAARNVAQKALDEIKRALHIKSPSRVMRDQVGKMIDLGIARGIEMNAGAVKDSIRTLGEETVSGVKAEFGDISTSGLNYNYNNNSVIDYNKLGQATTTALQKAGLTVSINNREFGRLIRGVK